MLKAERIKQKAIIIVPKYKIQGILYLPPDTRLTDFINTARQFIPVTDASIYDLDSDKLIEKPDFVQLNRNYIISITPIN